MSVRGDKVRVTVWHEFIHEKRNEAVRKVYPDGMHVTIKKGLDAHPGLDVRTATMDEPEHGLTEEVLASTDVLTWWGHVGHKDVSDEIAARVCRHVQNGMGAIFLHSAHFSKPFRALMGTTCSLRWREAAERERLWTIEPSHPIAEGIGEYIELPHTEMYGERFDVPNPDKVIFISWFEGGEVFRSGCTWQRGHGSIFYFRPGHETYPIYHDKQVIKVIANACRWARRRFTIQAGHCPCIADPIEKIGNNA